MSNQEISEQFVHGPEYLRAWDKDAGLRAEFDGDFEAYAHYCVAYERGSVRGVE